MATVRRVERRSVLLSALFVLVMPPLLLHGTITAFDRWPAVAVDEVTMLAIHSGIIAVATVAFRSRVDSSAGAFAVIAIVGPFASFVITAVVMGGGIHGPILLFLTKFYAAGFLLGLLAHRWRVGR